MAPLPAVSFIVRPVNNRPYLVALQVQGGLTNTMLKDLLKLLVIRLAPPISIWVPSEVLYE